MENQDKISKKSKTKKTSTETNTLPRVVGARNDYIALKKSPASTTTKPDVAPSNTSRTVKAGPGLRRNKKKQEIIPTPPTTPTIATTSQPIVKGGLRGRLPTTTNASATRTTTTSSPLVVRGLHKQRHRTNPPAQVAVEQDVPVEEDHSMGANQENGVYTSTPQEEQEQPAAEPLRSVSDRFLAQAVPVEDEDEVNDAQQAEEVDLEHQAERKKQRTKQRRQWLCRAFFILALMVLAVSLGLYFGLKDSRSTSATVIVEKEVVPTMAPSSSPTTSPSEAPSQAVIRVLQQSLPQPTQERLLNPSSPQSRAWTWLERQANNSLPLWRQQQLFALATFYYAMEGPSWPVGIRDDWLGDQSVLVRSECLWYSEVEQQCFDEQYRVLMLRGLNLHASSARIPPELALLTSLEFISLFINGINGTLSEVVPSSFLSQLPKNTGLVLNYNFLQGPVPSELGLLTSLSTLALSNNLLTGSLPTELFGIKELSFLNLRHNWLTGPLPSEVGGMKGLSYLWLEDNQLTGHLPTEVGLLQQLTDLVLDNNFLSGQLPSEVALLTSLASNTSTRNSFSLQYNSFSGLLPSEIGLMTSLLGVEFSFNAFTGELPSFVGWMTSLQFLNVDNNTFSGRLPTEIGLMSNLSHLSLGNNQFTGSLPSEIALLTSLKRLDLDSNYFTGTIPSELLLLTALQRLYLESNSFSGSSVFLMSSLLTENHVYVSIDSPDVLPGDLGQLSDLTKLVISDVSGTIPSAIGLLTSLTHLDLASNDFTGPLPSELGLMTSLTYLSLRNNAFSGTIPSELAMLGAYISATNNQFSGTIPQELCSMQCTSPHDSCVRFDCSLTLCGCDCPCLSLVQSSEYWEVWAEHSETECHIDPEGCIISHAVDERSSYRNNVLCKFRALQPGELDVVFFSTDDYDHVTVNSIDYSGDSGPQGVMVETGDVLIWQSDFEMTGAGDGFAICMAGSTLSPLVIDRITYSPTSSPSAAPSRLVQTSEYWDLLDVGCEISPAGCIRSHPFAGNGSKYGSNMYCRFVARQSGTLVAVFFETESDYDRLTVNGSDYSGTTGPEGISVKRGDTISWESDSSVHHPGFILCMAGTTVAPITVTMPTSSPSSAPSVSPLAAVDASAYWAFLDQGPCVIDPENCVRSGQSSESDVYCKFSARVFGNVTIIYNREGLTHPYQLTEMTVAGMGYIGATGPAGFVVEVAPLDVFEWISFPGPTFSVCVSTTN